MAVNIHIHNLLACHGTTLRLAWPDRSTGRARHQQVRGRILVQACFLANASLRCAKTLRGTYTFTNDNIVLTQEAPPVRED